MRINAKVIEVRRDMVSVWSDHAVLYGVLSQLVSSRHSGLFADAPSKVVVRSLTFDSQGGDYLLVGFALTGEPDVRKLSL